MNNIYNVKDFGAAGDGVIDDGQAFQEALNGASADKGGVFIPVGNYFIDKTLLVDDNTEIFGEGENIPVYGTDDKVAWLSNIKGPDLGTSMVSIAFSAMENLTIERLTLKNVPQDGIFVRNGGVNTVIKNNTIDGFNMLWFNGGGINTEYYITGNFPATKVAPVLIDGNTVIAKGPNYCYRQAFGATCDSHDDCINYPFEKVTVADPKVGKAVNINFCTEQEPGICKGLCGTAQPGGGSNLTGIVAMSSTKDKGEPRPAYVKITNNNIKASEFNSGINCVGCQDSVIKINTILPYESGTELSGLYHGILTAMHVKNIEVSNNTVTGTGKLKDKRAMTLTGISGLTAKGNIISNKSTAGEQLNINGKGRNERC